MPTCLNESNLNLTLEKEEGFLELRVEQLWTDHPGTTNRNTVPSETEVKDKSTDEAAFFDKPLTFLNSDNEKKLENKEENQELLGARCLLDDEPEALKKVQEYCVVDLKTGNETDYVDAFNVTLCGSMRKKDITMGEEKEKKKEMKRPNKEPVCRVVTPPTTNEENLRTETLPVSVTFAKRLELAVERYTLMEFSLYSCKLFLRPANGAVSLSMWIFQSVIEIALGFTYLNDCPEEHFIPVYLLLDGLFGFACGLIGILLKWTKVIERCDAERQYSISSLTIAIKWVLFIWFIPGCYWVFRIFPPNTGKQDGQRYCNLTLYGFSFLIVNLHLFLCISICTVALISICYYKVKKRPAATEIQTPQQIPASQ